MTKHAPPTEVEVLAALERSVTGSDGTRFSVTNRNDVADQVARSRGWDGHRVDGYESRTAAAGRFVSVSAVHKILDQLVADGKIYVVPGTHPWVQGRYYVTDKGTYYLTPGAVDLLIIGQHRQFVQDAESAAQERADKRVLNEHADDVSRYQQVYLAELMLTEPDWREQL